MKLFIDASALVAMLAAEPGHEQLAERLDAADAPRTSPLAIWEAVVALTRISESTYANAERDVRTFLEERRVAVGAIETGHAVGALAAFRHFGKGTGHPARLNMGDCFAYACAKADDAALLYKGDDFARTDLA